MINNNYASLFNGFPNGIASFSRINNKEWHNVSTPQALADRIIALKKGGEVERLHAAAHFVLQQNASDVQLQKLSDLLLSRIEILQGAAAASRKKSHKSPQKKHVNAAHPKKKVHKSATKKKTSKAHKKKSKKPAKSHKSKKGKYKKQAHKTKKVAHRVLPPPRPSLPTPKPILPNFTHALPIPAARYALLATQFPQYARFCNTNAPANFVMALEQANPSNEEHALTECCTTLLNHPANGRPEIQEITAALAAAIDARSTQLHPPSWQALIPQVTDWYSTFKNRLTFTHGQSLKMALETATIESNAALVHAVASNIFSSQTLRGTNVEVVTAPHRVHVILCGAQVGQGQYKTVFRADKISRDIISRQLVTEPVAYSDVRNGGQALMIDEFTIANSWARHQNHLQYTMLTRNGATGEYHLTQELCDCSLENIVNGSIATTTAQKLQICKDFLLGMLALERDHVIHNDIKKENILLQRLQPKIGDFGLSEQTPSIGTGSTKLGLFYGTPACGDMHLFADWDGLSNTFVLRGEQFTGDYSKIEKHACGNLLYEILYGQAPDWCAAMSRIHNNFTTHHNIHAIPRNEIGLYTAALTNWRTSKKPIRDKYNAGLQLTDRETIDFLIYRLTDPVLRNRPTARDAVAIIEETERRGVIFT